MGTRYDHEIYNWNIAGTGQPPRTVKELTEQEAKDALCQCLDVIGDIDKMVFLMKFSRQRYTPSENR